MKKFGLSSKERIKRKKEFDLIYSAGTTLYSSSQKIKLTYCLTEGSGEMKIKFGVAVSKKSGNAVWRNRVKRLLRESCRLNKFMLSGISTDRYNGLLMVFSPYGINQINNRKIALNEIMPYVVELILKLKKKI